MTLRESLRKPTVAILLINKFEKQFFSTIKEDEEQYAPIIDHLGKVPITVGTAIRALPFIHQNNQVNFDSLFIIGIINLTPRVAGIIYER